VSLATYQRAVGESVLRVLLRGTPSQIFGMVVERVAVKMADMRSREGARPVKNPSNDVVDPDTRTSAKVIS
jgi:hypothetical protein